jgi:endonuclease YncB( thermonuclease family)
VIVRQWPRARAVAVAVSFAAALTIATALPAPRASALVETFSGRCVGVKDGDSIVVLAGGVTHQIRLEGVDAPEKGQAFSSRAKQAMSDLVYGKDVVVAGKTTDSYGRLVARVSVGGLDTSLEMIRRGLAWHYKRYSSEQALADAEATARARRAGLWIDAAPVPPWSYRRSHPRATVDSNVE